MHSPSYFLSFLQVSQADFSEELELAGLRQELSKLIRANEGLERKLDEMDVKIGEPLYSLFDTP